MIEALVASIVMGVSAAQHERAAEVLEAFVASAGVAQIESFTTEGERLLQTPQGDLVASVRVDFVAPDQFRESSKLPFGEIVTVVRGDAAWASTPRGTRDLTADQRKRTMDGLYRSYLGLLWATVSGQVAASYERDTEIQGERASELMLRVDGFEMRGFFDRTSGRLKALVLPGADLRGTAVTEQRMFEAFETRGGVTLPTRAKILHDGEVAASVALVTWSVNESPPPETFEKEPAR